MVGFMHWPSRDLLTMKQELVEFALRPGVNRRELFSRYGISAPCAYKWLKRYQSKGVEGLAEHSRRPITIRPRLGRRSFCGSWKCATNTPLGVGARFIIICAKGLLAPYQLPVPLPRSCVVTVGLIPSIPAPKVLGNASNILPPTIFGRWILKARCRPSEPAVVIPWASWMTIRFLLSLYNLAPIIPLH